MTVALPVRVVLVDDHALFREGMKRVLEAEGAMHVVAEAATLEGALDLCVHGPICDLALIDYDLGGDGKGDGVQVLHALREHQPEIRAVIVTGGLIREAIDEATSALHASVFLKSEPMADLLVLIHKTLRGEAVLSAGVQKFLDAAEMAGLPRTVTFSAKELLVLRLITEGLANKEIADCAEVTETNVKAIIQRLFLKTGVRSRSQLVRYVFEFGVELH